MYTRSHADLVALAGLHGMRVGPIDPFLRVLGYWFCAGCGEGGVVAAGH